jgi:hypothetical protein
MIRLNPASRAFLMAAGLVVAMGSGAVAAEESATVTTTETTTVATETPEEPFLPTIYFGPSFGYADQHDSEFGWTFHTLMRPLEYLAIQIEYVNLGSNPPPDTSGEYDGVYFGLAPMYPVMPRLDIFAQVGLVVGDPGDDFAGGVGVMYQIPVDWLDKINVDINLLAQYKYLNWADGDHLVTFGVLFGVHK